MYTMESLARELTATYWQEKKCGSPKKYSEILYSMYQKYKGYFEEYSLNHFKSCVLKANNELKKGSSEKKSLERIPINPDSILPKRNSTEEPSEWDGQIFTLNQIENLDLNPDSYI